VAVSFPRAMGFWRKNEDFAQGLTGMAGLVFIGHVTTKAIKAMGNKGRERRRFMQAAWRTLCPRLSGCDQSDGTMIAEAIKSRIP